MQKRHFMMKNFIGFLLVIILMSSCSEYQKLLKSGDSQAMYKKAVEYYNNGDYTKASNLFDGIRMVFQGTSKAQSVAYYRAFCSYNQKDYEVAAELFKQFVSIYPRRLHGIFSMIRISKYKIIHLLHLHMSRIPQNLCLHKRVMKTLIRTCSYFYIGITVI